MGIVGKYINNVKSSIQGWKNIAQGNTLQGDTSQHTGSWGTKDYGISEIFKPFVASPVKAGEYINMKPNNIADQWTASFNNSGNNGNTGSGNQVLGSSDMYKQGQDLIQGQQDTGNQNIDADYENAMSMLSASEGVLRSQAGAASGQIDTNVASTTNELKNNQTANENSLSNQQGVAETGSQSAMQNARDLFRQTQQANIAQLSGMGISSSSVAEALAERLGVETARRIASVSQSLQDVRMNVAKELTRVKEYYTGKVDALKSWANDQKASIQNALIQGLNNINAARGQAASDKAQARASLLTQTQQAIYNLANQQQQFQQSLDAWAAQKESALGPMITDPNFTNTLTQATNTFNQNYAPTGFQYVPEVNTNPTGRVTGNIGYTLQKKNELEDPFATQTQ